MLDKANIFIHKSMLSLSIFGYKACIIGLINTSRPKAAGITNNRHIFIDSELFSLIVLTLLFENNELRTGTTASAIDVAIIIGKCIKEYVGHCNKIY